MKRGTQIETEKEKGEREREIGKGLDTWNHTYGDKGKRETQGEKTEINKRE